MKQNGRRESQGAWTGTIESVSGGGLSGWKVTEKSGTCKIVVVIMATERYGTLFGFNSKGIHE
jgi:hypothetical protein